MAPLPIDNTPRFKVFYTNCSVQHVMDIRSPDSPFAFGLNVDDLLNALLTVLTPTVIDEVQWAPSGSNIFNNVVTGIEGNTYGAGAISTLYPAFYTNFVGRSTGGRRVRLAVFGTTNIAQDYRFVAGENAAIDAAIAALQVAANHFTAIDGLKPVWKTYANAGLNAYWQRKLRP